MDNYQTICILLLIVKFASAAVSPLLVDEKNLANILYNNKPDGKNLPNNKSIFERWMASFNNEAINEKSLPDFRKEFTQKPNIKKLSTAGKSKKSYYAGEGIPTKKNTKGDSKIFFIRLPPTPYMMVPGLGYISKPPTIKPLQTEIQSPFSILAGMAGNMFDNQEPAAVVNNQGYGGIFSLPPTAETNDISTTIPHVVNIIKEKDQLAAENSSDLKNILKENDHSANQDSKIERLQGPYFFNGRPYRVYVLPKNDQNWGGVNQYY